MQTELHIAALTAELKRALLGATVETTQRYRKERTALLRFRQGKNRWTLGLVYLPHGYGAFLVPASKVKLDTREQPRPVFAVDGAIVTGVSQLDFDRVIRLELESGSEKMAVIIEALGPNGNLWLLDAENRKAMSLRKKTYQPGDRYAPPQPPEKLHPVHLTATELTEAVGGATFLDRGLMKAVRGLDEVLTAEILHRAGLADTKPSELTGEQWDTLRTTIADLAQRFLSPERGYLYRLPALNYACPFRLKRVAEEPEKFKTLSLAVWAGMRERRTSASAADESQQLTAAVSRMLKRLQRRMANIEKDIAEASDFERYRQMGELLKINRHRLTKGMDAITVENVFVEPPRDIRIPLDPALSPEDNIERCFQRYRKGRDGLALLQRRLEITRAELEQWRAIERALQEDFDTAAERYRSELASVLPKTAERKTEQPRLPYREFTLSTGVRVLVGRDGSDNDRTTFEFAKPYELWFHTQQCPGSHVVMKFPNKAFTPSRTEIAEAAAIAAWHSKARRDSLVPVIYTQRKYVRKPRKAKPGLVTVEREKSVMVAPQKPSTEPG